MNYTPEQFQKLPKWAQDEILRLQNNHQSLLTKLDEINGDSETNTFLVEGLSERPLPKNSCVDFKVGENNLNTVSVYIRKNGTIDINANSKMAQQLVIVPNAANSFYLKFVGT